MFCCANTMYCNPGRDSKPAVEAEKTSLAKAGNLKLDPGRKGDYILFPLFSLIPNPSSPSFLLPHQRRFLLQWISDIKKWSGKKASDQQ